MCESRDLGIKWAQWHTFLFEGRVAADMRVVCPQDGKKMHLKQDRMVCWKRWAAKHVCEELKAAKAHQCVVDGFASQHAEEAGRRGIMGAGENVRRWVVGRKEVARLRQ